MSGGRSQMVQGFKAALKSSALEKQAAREAAQSRRNRAGCAGEQAVCAALSVLALEGIQHLDDLRCRADTAQLANIDHLVIAPTGVFVVDAKNWAGSISVQGASILQDGVRRDERLIALTYMAQRVEEIMATSSAAAVRPVQVVCFASAKSGLSPVAGPTHLTDVTRIGAFLSSRPTVLTAAQVAELTELLAHAFPPYQVDETELAHAEGLLFPEVVTRHAGLAEALTRPVQDWMVWLHPEQAASVRRSFAGPARIRGAAGTGKTVVGLHRVAYLAATRPGRFLVTSFVRTLPQVLEDSYRRLSPQTVERVDFQAVHAVAVELLRERGHAVRVNNGDAAFTRAWAAHGGALKASALAAPYFKEEISAVIKGRDVTSLEEYLQLDRLGRRAQLGSQQRRAVWQVYEAYEAELQRAGSHDFTDVLRMARDETRRAPCARWIGVLVDEAQDIPMVGLQLLYELAGRDRHDGLLLIGDGQQAIYPGGFRLVDAGISVAGRATVLRVNYRNTVEVLAAAGAVVAGDTYDDLDLVGQPGERPTEVVRHGDVVGGGLFPTRADQDEAMLWDLHAALDRGTPAESVAVLVQTNAQAEFYDALLRRNGVPSMLLKTASLDAPGVRVGTWFRSKGMEFGDVFMPSSNDLTSLTTGAGANAREEKEELLRRTQYVAMTRARDALWLGRVG